MSRHDALHALCGSPVKEATNLQAVASENPPLLLNRTDIEDQLRSVLPDDPVEGHPLEVKHNPYLYHPRSELKLLIHRVGRQEQLLIQEALRLQQLWQSDGVMPGKP